MTNGTSATTAATIRRHQGERIRTQRTSAGLSRRQVADTLGVTIAAVSHWENGTTTPRQHHQAALAQMLGLRWADLFTPEVAA